MSSELSSLNSTCKKKYTMKQFDHVIVAETTKKILQADSAIVFNPNVIAMIMSKKYHLKKHKKTCKNIL